VPGAPLPTSHPDYPFLRPLVDALVRAAGGITRLEQEIPQIIRKSIDEVIDATRTNRFTLSDTEKTEKTYLGTKIEIMLRAYFGLPKGQALDLAIKGIDTDIKNTMSSGWTIPIEAFGHPCLLIRENEKTATCSFGIVVAHEKYLNPGRNRDAKTSFSAAGLANVWWILKDHPYPRNFWETMPLKQRKKIMAAGGGTMRLAELFKAVQKTPISRLIVQGVAQQDDYMKRIRRNGGARDILAPQGIAILWGRADRNLIVKLGLSPIGPDEFISYTPRSPSETKLLRDAGHID
jgi:hypothetical protein